MSETMPKSHAMQGEVLEYAMEQQIPGSSTAHMWRTADGEYYVATSAPLVKTPEFTTPQLASRAWGCVCDIALEDKK